MIENIKKLEDLISKLITRTEENITYLSNESKNDTESNKKVAQILKLLTNLIIQLSNLKKEQGFGKTTEELAEKDKAIIQYFLDRHVKTSSCRKLITNDLSSL